MLKDYKNYNSGYTPTYIEWLGKYSNCEFDYFARHKDGKSKRYRFNGLGYRGPEHWPDPDISVFGSSFSFGVGMEFSQCWHQLLGNYKVNCYAPAGIPVRNEDIIDHYHRANISSGIVILQLREFSYSLRPFEIPKEPLVFVVDSYLHDDLFGFYYDDFEDKAEDNTHPGPLTHAQWAKALKIKYNL